MKPYISTFLHGSLLNLYSDTLVVVVEEKIFRHEQLVATEACRVVS
jgi:hypothetical protein